MEHLRLSLIQFVHHNVMHLHTTLSDQLPNPLGTYLDSIFFLQAKAYARAHGYPTEWRDGDRFAVDTYIDEDTVKLIGPVSTSMLLMCAFILANLLVMIVALLFFDNAFLWLQSGNKLRALYIASGVVLAIINVVTFVCEIKLLNQLFSNQFDSHTMISMYYVAVKLPLMVLAFTVEIITISYNTYKHQSMKCLHWLAHSLACCHILWFIHRLATDVIMSTMSFILAPAQTLGILTLILSTVACMIIFVACVVHKGLGGGCNRRTSLPVLSAILIGITTCGLVFIFTLLFIALVDNGLKSTGIGGFILSLLPPSIIFIAGLFVEWKYVPNFSHHVVKFSESRREKNTKRDRRTRSSDRSHLCLSGVSVQIGKEENMSLKDSVLNGSSITVDENTPLLH